MAQVTMQDREKALLEALRRIPKDNTVLIGGYAVNAYVPPRLSIDCDLVALGDVDMIESSLKENGFTRTETGDVPYGNYARYEKGGASFDLSVNAVFDRETGITFERNLFEEHSRVRTTVGRTNPIRIEMRIADPELLFVMKFVTGRRLDIRDMFMLAAENSNWKMVIDIVSEKCGGALIKKRIGLIRHSVYAKNYKDSLEGPYGKFPDQRFNFCKTRFNEFLGKLERSGKPGKGRRTAAHV
jgi:hypothetical protein